MTQSAGYSVRTRSAGDGPSHDRCTDVGPALGVRIGAADRKKQLTMRPAQTMSDTIARERTYRLGLSPPAV